MGPRDAVEQGRSAAADRRWGVACECFGEAHRADAGGLSERDLEMWSTALFLRGELAAALRALRSAHDRYLSRDDIVGAARAAGWMAIQQLEAGDVAGAGTWSARGVRLGERLDGLSAAAGMIALVPAAFGAMFTGDVREAIGRFDRIAAMAEAAGDADLAAHADFGRGMCLTTLGQMTDGLRSFDRAMTVVAAGSVSPITTCVIVRMALDAAHGAWDLERAERWTSMFARWCDAQPELIAYTGQSFAYRAKLAALRGEWSDATVAAQQALACLRAGDFTAAYVAHYELADLHRLRGRLHAAEEHYRLAGETGWDPQPGLALTRLADGDVSLAQSMIRLAAAGIADGTRPRLLPAIVLIEVAAGDVAAARLAADELITLAGGSATALLTALAAHADARVLLADGRASEALGPVEAARAMFSTTGARYCLARNRLLGGRILAATGEAHAARVEWIAARETFTDLGAHVDVDAANALIGDRTPDTLTPRETDVLRLVAKGGSNRDVASQLSLSEKTVARHLSNIYGKLHVTSRTAATSFAYEQGLV